MQLLPAGTGGSITSDRPCKRRLGARLRGEAGVPLVWLFPYNQQKNWLLYTFGSVTLGLAAVALGLLIAGEHRQEGVGARIG